MKVSYKKLWKMLIDRDMTKTQLRVKAKISTTTLTKLSKNENVGTEILAKICNAMECNVGDIVEFVTEEQEHSEPRSKE
ncbi:helix-turn-helix transcriptional regulator [Anaerocolumna sp. AGMB13025]|uniref:helix-turn-helix domain-containing protein n=1 Tax=Anaerocolumna sp. AGMB13025 TaxID=3039116 RepID=UPI00241CEAD1|nr:helix-turn-helix transcriptional regulator [Anaerocolumna sp. AGMB13025]WFR57217.1 helix-turn-helix transcriptional regulator [Anaerocolumna sp. AGMB13025]